MTSTLIALLPVLINVLLAALNGFGVAVPPNVAALIQQLVPVAEKVIADIQAGKANDATASQETVTLLQEMLPVVQAVRQDTSLDPKYTKWATLIEEMVADVMIADADALKGVDPSKLHAE